MDVLQSIQQSIEQKIEGLTQQKNWQWKAAFIVSFFSVISTFTNVVPLSHFYNYFEALVANKEYFAFQTIADRARYMTGNHHYPSMSGLENRTFRWTLPAFVKIFHLYPASIWLYLFQFPFGILFFKLLLSFFSDILKDKIAAFWATLAIATTYLGMSFWIDFSGYGDFYSYFFLFLAVYFRSPYLVFLFCQLAFWNDERGFVAGVFVLLWWWFVPQWQTNRSFKVEFRPQVLAVLVAWFAYVAFRFGYLEAVLGMHSTYNEGEFEATLPQNLKVFGFKIGWGLEGLWLIVLFAFMVLWKTNDRLRLFFMASALVAFSLLAMTIYDTTRSSAFAYIIVFPCLVVLAENTEKQRLRAILLLIALLCFLHPLATKTNAIGFFLM